LLKDNYEVLGIDNLNDYYNPQLKKDRLAILSDHDNFTFKKINISDRDTIFRAFKEFNPQKVINLAAQVGVRYSLENPEAYTETNINGFLNILEACRKNKIEGLVYASSSSVYGEINERPSNVNDKTDSPISLYGATKKANELMAHSYSHLYDINTTGLRFFTVYGPWYRPDMAINIFAEKIFKKQTIEVFNYGKMKRDFTYIDDIVQGTCSALENNYNCDVFNLGNNTSVELMRVINEIENALNMKASINFLPLQLGDVVETYADINYSTKKLNYKPSIDIEEGIKKFISWFKGYYDS